ncbi:hypothetical protein ACQEVC_38130 [Plantactinospora sp. CA-294935]|uniref:hypothetical protein n=1 Tax=Plantactinospora sp. CA-294935 TaxID=3240012 RepID=UPI003D8BE74F
MLPTVAPVPAGPIRCWWPLADGSVDRDGDDDNNGNGNGNDDNNNNGNGDDGDGWHGECHGDGERDGDRRLQRWRRHRCGPGGRPGLPCLAPGGQA